LFNASQLNNFSAISLQEKLIFNEMMMMSAVIKEKEQRLVGSESG
jgi:hypothetical protein